LSISAKRATQERGGEERREKGEKGETKRRDDDKRDLTFVLTNITVLDKIMATIFRQRRYKTRVCEKLSPWFYLSSSSPFSVLFSPLSPEKLKASKGYCFFKRYYQK
jgi:hypothetical protein